MDDSELSCEAERLTSLDAEERNEARRTFMKATIGGAALFSYCEYKDINLLTGSTDYFKNMDAKKDKSSSDGVKMIFNCIVATYNLCTPILLPIIYSLRHRSSHTTELETCQEEMSRREFIKVGRECFKLEK